MSKQSAAAATIYESANVYQPLRIDPRLFLYWVALRKVKRYVQEHYAGKVTLADAAGVANMTATYFSAFFHAKTGVCFRTWLTHFRIEKAMEMFSLQDYNVTEVCYAVGYSDMRTFERAFIRIVGMQPRQFKRTMQPVQRLSSLAGASPAVSAPD